MGVMTVSRQYQQLIRLTGGGAGPAVATFIGTFQLDGGASISSNFTLGAGSAGRRVVVVVNTAGFNGGAITGCTVAGNSATEVRNRNRSGAAGTQASAAIYEIVDTTSNVSTAIAATFSGFGDGAGLSVYVITGASGAASASDFDDDGVGAWSGTDITLSATLSVPTNGCAIAGGALNYGGGAHTFDTYSNLTEDADGGGSNPAQYNAAHQNSLTGGSTAFSFVGHDGFSTGRAAAAVFAVWG